MLKLLIFIFLVNIPDAFCQQKMGYGNNLATINYKDSTLQVELAEKGTKVNTSLDKYYAWYASNTIMTTMGSYDGKLLNGEYRCFYLNKNFKSKGNYNKGLKNGEWLEWNEMGGLKTAISWKNGLLDGDYKSYDLDGKLSYQANYRENQLNGSVFLFSDGKCINEQHYKKGKEVIKTVKNKDKKIEKSGDNNRNNSFFGKIKRFFSFKKRQDNSTNKKRND